MSEISLGRWHAFAPDAQRAVRIDQNVRDGLAAALSAIFQDLGADLAIDAHRSQALLDAIITHPVSPRLIAEYADLVEAIYANDDRTAQALIHTLLDETPQAGAIRVLTLSDEDLGAGQSARYARHALADDRPMTLAPVSAEAKARVAGLFDGVMALLDAAAPELSAEIRSLVRELVLVRDADAHSEAFDGATTFYLWGALLLNATRITGRVQLATAVVHEAAHAFLFGVNLGARLTENADAEVCASPLRVDPRPVEGVFHATFVLARMIYALDRLVASGLLCPEEQTAASDMVSELVKSFEDGKRSLAMIAKLSPAGAALLAQAETYVHTRIDNQRRVTV